MRRVFLGSLVVVVGCLAAGFALNGLPKGPGANNPKYWVEVDNAFGLNLGGDFKVAGVRAGKIMQITLDRRTLRALVQVRIDQKGFGSLRADVHCDVRPQSLIGEYFMDCEPGTSPRIIKPGSLIPVSHTSSTIAPDLVNDIARMPERDGLRLIIGELGAGVAGNAHSLQLTLRRASPALREVDKVLAILAQQSRTINDLNVNADTVLASLAANRRDVGRWVVRTRNIAHDSADRRQALAAGFHRLPGFLEQLRPAMAALGRTADAQVPALHNLDVSAPQLRRFFGDLGPFANASRPAIRALGDTSVTGARAVTDATPTVRQLNTFAQGTPELARNLAIVLEYLDNRKNTAENDVRASRQQGVNGPSGYSGLESILQYVMDQTNAINIYDGNFHILNVAAFDGGPCDQYANAARRRAQISTLKDCIVYGGPISPGNTTPDPSAGLGPFPPDSASPGVPSASTRARARSARRSRSRSAAQPNAAQGAAQVATGSTGSGSGGGVPVVPAESEVAPHGMTPTVPQAAAPAAAPSASTQSHLLDYLLGR